MDNNKKREIRRLKNGDWYWINRRVFHFYGRSIKASGIAVYNVLASYANFKNQVCFPTQKAIAKLIGMSKRTVIRRIKQLERLGLLSVEKRKGRCFYHLLRPKVTKETQGGDKRDTGEVTLGNTNKNYLTRVNNKNIDNKNFLDSKLKTFKGFGPRTREELLAIDIARKLNDLKALSLYLSYAKKYPESLLRKTLGEVMEIPPERIKKSRGALFNHLVKKYAQKTSKNHRD